MSEHLLYLKDDFEGILAWHRSEYGGTGMSRKARGTSHLLFMARAPGYMEHTFGEPHLNIVVDLTYVGYEVIVGEPAVRKARSRVKEREYLVSWDRYVAKEAEQYAKWAEEHPAEAEQHRAEAEARNKEAEERWAEFKAKREALDARLKRTEEWAAQSPSNRETLDALLKKASEEDLARLMVRRGELDELSREAERREAENASEKERIDERLKHPTWRGGLDYIEHLHALLGPFDPEKKA